MTAMLRKDFDEFLYSPVASESDGTPVTLLTALARLGVDPWEEAADLALLSREPALQRLASRLEAMPNGPATAADTVNIATRLIGLLNRTSPSRAASPAVPAFPAAMKLPMGRSVAIYCLLGLIFMLAAQWAVSNRQAQPPPMDTTISTGSAE